MVSIGAFQALDPSSILGRRKFFLTWLMIFFIAHTQVSNRSHNNLGSFFFQSFYLFVQFIVWVIRTWSDFSFIIDHDKSSHKKNPRWS